MGMIRFYTKIQIFFIMIVFILSQDLYSCVVTLYNDGPRSILVIDHATQQNQSPSSIPLISKGTSRRLGEATKHADFTIYTKSPKGNIFITAYHVQQNECGKTGNPYLKLSDIKKGTGETGLFTITATSSSHSPMVRQLPSLQKADIYKEEPMSTCSKCQG